MKTVETIIQNQTKEVQIDPDSREFIVGNNRQEYSFEQQSNGRRLLRVGHHLYKIDDVTIQPHEIEFTINGRWFHAKVRDERDMLLDEMGFKTAAEIGEGQLKAPMPGKIIELGVKEGDDVERGDPVAILEAMKMENELKAPIAGTVSSIDVAEGDSLEKNASILEIKVHG
jgi:pyruvate carboxylase subunit B